MEFKSNLKAALSEFDKKMDQACEIIGGIIESAAKDLAPVDTGLLRNSITHGKAGGKLSITEYTDDAGNQSVQYPVADIPAGAGGAKYVVVVGTNVQYAPYQELGAPNAHVPPAPFLRPAFEGNRESIKAALEQVLKA